MRILIVSRLFPPSNAIGAVRPKNMADYLHECGHEITCVTDVVAVPIVEMTPYRVLRVATGRIGKWFSRHNAKRASEVSISHTEKKEQNDKVSVLSIVRSKLNTQVRNVLFVVDELEWAQNVVKTLCAEPNNFSFDIVITSFGPLSAVLIGRRLKRKHKRTVWISDMRDAMDVYSQAGWRRLLFASIQKRMTREADAITTVSRAMTDKFSRLNGAPVYTIENGYAHILSEASSARQDGALVICYTGSLYGGLRMMDALFTAIAEIKRRHNGASSIVVRYAGADGQSAMEQARAYDVQEQLDVRGVLSRKEAAQLQESADVLCVVSWNTKHEQGILTGKFPEYMRLRKPILSIVSGDLPDAELSERVRECGDAGMDFEYVRERDKERLTAWLDALASQKKSGCPLPTIPAVIVEKYDYKNLMATFNKIVVETEGRK